MATSLRTYTIDDMRVCFEQSRKTRETFEQWIVRYSPFALIGGLIKGTDEEITKAVMHGKLLHADEHYAFYSFNDSIYVAPRNHAGYRQEERK